MLGIAFEIRAQCRACGGPLFVNAVASQVACPACNTPLSLDAEGWQTLLEDGVGEAPAADEGDGRTMQVLASSLGQLSILYGRQHPRCGACKTLVPLDDPGSLAARGFAICVGCGQRLSLRHAPPGMLDHLIEGEVLLVGEDLAQLAGTAAPVAAAGGQPIVFTCPQCAASLPVDGTSRTVGCEYCRASVYLPDDLWHRLHPVKTATRWYLWLDARQIKKRDADLAVDDIDEEAAERVEEIQERVAEAQTTARKTSFVAWLVPLLIMGIIGGSIWGVSWFTHNVGRADEINDVYVVGSPKGPVLATLEQVRTSQGTRHRLSFVETRTGKRRERVKLDDYSVGLVGVSGTVLWVYEAKAGLLAYDGLSGRLLADEEGLLKRNPGLRGRLMHGAGNERHYGLDTGRALIIRTNQGHPFRIAPGAWTATRVAGAPEMLSRRPDRFEDCWGAHIGNRYWRFEGQHRKRLVDGSGRTVAADRAARDGFLEPRLICRDTGESDPLVLSKPESLLLVQKTSLDDKATEVLTRVTMDGRVVWTAPVGLSVRSRSPAGVFVSESRLIVVGQRSYHHHEAVALDLRTGRTLWRYEY